MYTYGGLVEQFDRDADGGGHDRDSSCVVASASGGLEDAADQLNVLQSRICRVTVVAVARTKFTKFF